MKILLVGRCVTSLSPRSGGGAEWHGYHLAMALDKLGHDVHYVTNYSDPIDFNSVTTYNTYTKISPNDISRFPFMGFNKWLLKHFKENIYAAMKARSILAQEKDFDVIHCHGNLVAFVLSKEKERIPVLYTEHDAPPWICAYRTLYERLMRKSFYYALNKSAMERISHLITVSDAQRDFLVNKWHIPKEKITTISSGVDIKMFSPSNNHNEYVRKKYSLPENYSIFVGRLEPRKGVDYLIKSMENVEITSMIIGEGPDRIRLEDLAIENGVHHKIMFTGGVSNEDLKSLYARARFFVLPSISEGLPLTILEAMSSGIPVIANNINGISEIVRHKYNGLLTRPNDVNSLSNAQRTLINDTSLCKEMGINARATVEKNYSWESVARRMTKVYEMCKYE